MENGHLTAPLLKRKQSTQDYFKTSSKFPNLGKLGNATCKTQVLPVTSLTPLPCMKGDYCSWVCQSKSQKSQSKLAKTAMRHQQILCSKRGTSITSVIITGNAHRQPLTTHNPRQHASGAGTCMLNAPEGSGTPPLSNRLHQPTLLRHIVIYVFTALHPQDRTRKQFATIKTILQNLFSLLGRWCIATTAYYNSHNHLHYLVFPRLSFMSTCFLALNSKLCHSIYPVR